MRIMGIDYGDARTGVAISDLLCSIVGSAQVVPSRNTDKAVADIVRLARENQVGEIAVGLPRNMDGTEGSRANKSRRFAQRLANTAGVPVVLWDERRTTVSAAAILADNDTFGQKRKEKLDSVSAAVILESFLNWRAHHPGETAPEQLMPRQEQV